ncbi:large conductance mechanosensitive channel protein MscL [Aerococcus christensenii]|uniref:Large-conductance mechanosensitive channel n=1 Tax=Aerococcus christensenii TaxID=87541 RepID=A0A133Y4M6_9LACT|nr:large conductance mechanosensitive channel protein MscL [Aerococcus christensenii]KXB38153.1 large conductance mechanosensitive channel protein [Aerococcus christensenii]MDK8233757.1 large conductance mechanosensitive channel protein MscL [Aerococcus christensenii]
MLKEFKEFMARGNVVDLAIGVVMGTAFTAIVNSIVKDLITPLIGVIMGNIDLSGYKLVLAGATFGIGNFINAVISFLVISLVLFLIVKVTSRFKKLEESAVDALKPSQEEVLLTEIRDLLKNK